MVDVFNKTFPSLVNAEYNKHNSQQLSFIEEIWDWLVTINNIILEDVQYIMRLTD